MREGLRVMVSCERVLVELRVMASCHCETMLVELRVMVSCERGAKSNGVM